MELYKGYCIVAHPNFAKLKYNGDTLVRISKQQNGMWNMYDFRASMCSPWFFRVGSERAAFAWFSEQVTMCCGSGDVIEGTTWVQGGVPC